MDSVASNTSKEESTHVSPQYDSSEEWEIGLGNLIIDLDADLEKDRQDGSGGGSNGGGTSADSSPLRIGKMKIKRKVSTNTGAVPKGSEGTSPRKDNSLLSNEDSGVSTGHISPTPSERMVKEEKVTKSGGRSVSGGGGGASAGASSSGPHHKQDANAIGKHLERDMTSTKGSISLTSGDIHHGKYSSGSLQQQDKDNVDNNICRIKTSVDHKQQTVCKKEKETTGGGAGGGRKKEEKEGKESTGKKGGDGSIKKHGGKKRAEKASSSNSIAVGTSDAETLTEPECLGPCEPGTSVNLEGIVWHETDQGVLVVNVTWRNKTYVGTLLDCTKHDWAPPRFCDSPTSDIENRSTKTCGRPKRGRASNNSNSNDMSNFTETRSSIHSKLRNSAALKGRKGASANGSRTPPGPVEKPEKPQGKRKHRPSEVSASSGDDSKSAKRLKSSAKHNPPEVVSETPSGLIECPEPNCNKKYKHINGLRYHRQHAHQEDKPDDDDEDQDSENKSSSDESSVASAQTDSVKSKSDWNDSNRTSDTSTNDTKATTADNEQVEQSAEKRQLQYSTAAAQAAATAAANAAAANMELLHSKEDGLVKSSKGHKQLLSDKTSPKILHSSLGKSKDSMPAKAKGDSSEKAGGKQKKGHSSTEKDLSVFDFNSAVDSDGVNEPLGSDKHVSVIRPTADMSTTSPSKSSEPITAMVSAPAKLQDVIHTTALPGSEHLEELQKHSKKAEKDKSKSGDRKKGKHDKVPSSKVKPTRPVTTSPTPPQLVAVPANMPAKGATTPGTAQPLKIPPANAKQPANPALKPIQPKPPVMSEATATPPVTNTKEKKSKSKKKSKDKDKEREKSSSAKDKESKDSNMTNNKQAVQPLQIPAVKQQQVVAPTVEVPPAVPKQPPQQPGPVSSVLAETNILHQALTASGIGPEDAERNSPSVTNSGEVPKTDSSQPPKDQSKESRPVFPNRPPPMHGNMPEIPKLIPTSSVVNSGGRSVGSVQPHLPPHQVKPIQSVQDNSKIEKSTLPLPQMKAGLLGDTDTNAQNTSTGNTEESRSRSPAYSDISDANEESEVPAKAMNDRDPYSFPDASRNQAKVGSRDEHIHSKSLFTPLSDVGRERLPEGMQKAQQDPHRTVPPLIQPPKGDGGKEGSHTEGPDAKKPRKDTSSPRLPAAGEAGYRPPSQAYSGQYPYMSAGFVMDPQYHMHLFNTDPHYRQQHEQFRQEQRQLAEKERIDRERHERSTKEKPVPGKVQEENRERTIPRIKTEPVTPPKRNVVGEKGQERGKPDRPPSAEKLKRKQLDFQKPSTESAASTETSSERPNQEESSRQGTKAFIHQQHQEEMRQYYIYQKKVQEQQKYEEEQRRKLEETRSNPENLSNQKDKENRNVQEESRERHRSGKSPSPQRNPPKSKSPGQSSAEGKLRQSPGVSSPSPMSKESKAAMSSSSSRKVLDYPAYLQHTPYGPMPVHQTPYGPIPIDPNHPAYQHVNPLIYPAYMGHELRYSSGPMVSPMWKSPDEKGHFEHERSRAISPHQPPTSRGSSPSDPPPKALELLQQHASRYYSSHKHDRPRSPDKSRTSSPQRRPTSPRKSPEASSSSREQREATAMVHQHMHTHQHTHVGYPAVLPPYDPFVIASQQAAAAAAAGVPPPYSVRRENMPP